MKHFFDPKTYSILHRGIKGYINFASQPSDFVNVTDMASLMKLPVLVDAWNKDLQDNNQLQQLYQEQYQLQVDSSDLQELVNYPENSLGHIFAREMLEKGFNPSALTEESGNTLAGDSFIEYIHNLRISTHDLHHIVTGFDTSIAGEVGVTAVYFAQLRAPISSFLIGSALAHCVFEPDWYYPITKAMTLGFEIGERAQNLLTVHWQEQWHKPLTQLRQELNITVVPEKECSSANLEHSALAY